MDEVFGKENFRNELYWYYYNKMHDARKPIFPRATDTILFYARSASLGTTFNRQKEDRETAVRQLVRKKVGGKMVNARDDEGNVLYRDAIDRTVDNVWRIPMLQPADKTQNLAYATQKPEALIERIISTSSSEDDLVATSSAERNDGRSSGKTRTTLDHVRSWPLRHSHQPQASDESQRNLIGKKNPTALRCHNLGRTTPGGRRTAARRDEEHAAWSGFQGGTPFPPMRNIQMHITREEARPTERAGRGIPVGQMEFAVPPRQWG